MTTGGGKKGITLREQLHKQGDHRVAPRFEERTASGKVNMPVARLRRLFNSPPAHEPSITLWFGCQNASIPCGRCGLG